MMRNASLRKISSSGCVYNSGVFLKDLAVVNDVLAVDILSNQNIWK